ncbi:hypothetical protein ACFQE1_10935 [Halobium palmae]|uniref:Uncharacterized protein n=1 Tax=Halobium palmae TaxID=1776492 RepID=A0ABD5RZM6_9EURY
MSAVAQTFGGDLLGGAASALSALLYGALLLAPVLVGYLVYRDTAGRGSDHPLAWAVGVAVFFLFTFPVALVFYFVVRDDVGPAPTGADREARTGLPRSRPVAAAFTLLAVLAFLYSVVIAGQLLLGLVAAGVLAAIGAAFWT